MKRGEREEKISVTQKKLKLVVSRETESQKSWIINRGTFTSLWDHHQSPEDHQCHLLAAHHLNKTKGCSPHTPPNPTGSRALGGLFSNRKWEGKYFWSANPKVVQVLPRLSWMKVQKYLKKKPTHKSMLVNQKLVEPQGWRCVVSSFTSCRSFTTQGVFLRNPAGIHWTSHGNSN